MNLLITQKNLLSLWLPPLTYPQFFGMLTFQLIQSSPQRRILYIRKYYWYRHGVSRKMFGSLLSWARNEYDDVEALGMTVGKEEYEATFREWGWEMQGWKAERLRITYRNFYN